MKVKIELKPFTVQVQIEIDVIALNIASDSSMEINAGPENSNKRRLQERSKTLNRINKAILEIQTRPKKEEEHKHARSP